jgi:hypothetical protein
MIYFYYQLVEWLVMEIDNNGLLRMMHVPEDSLAVLIERSRRDDTGHIRSRHPDAMIPTACNLRVGSDTRDVDEWDFEAALECPQLVSAPNVQRQIAFGYRQIDHETPLQLSGITAAHLLRGSPYPQNPRGGEAACANGNADGRNAEPVEQGENLIGAADQGQRWHDDADWEHFDSEPGPERQPCNQQHTKTVAKVKLNPSSPREAARGTAAARRSPSSQARAYSLRRAAKE